MRKFVLLFIFQLLVIMTFSQPNFLRFFPVNSADYINTGLHDITQDKYGFIWIASENGVYRYDGYNFESFGTSDDTAFSVTNVYINTILANDNKIWIGSDAGLNILDLQTDTIKHFFYSPNKPNNARFFYFYAEKDTVWIASSLGLITFVNSNEYKITNKKGLIGKILKYHNRLIITGSYTTIYDYQKDTILFFQKNDFFINASVITDSIIFLGNYLKGLRAYILRNDTIIPYENIPNSLKDLEINDLAYDKKSKNLIIATESGLWIYNLKTNQITHQTKNIENPYSLPTNNIHKLFIDNRNFLWLLTYDKGIYFANLNKEPFLHYITDKDQKINLKNLTAIIQPSDNEVFAGSTNGLYVYNLKDLSVKYFSTKTNPKLTDNLVTSFVQVGNQIWIGEDLGGIDIYLPENQQIINFDNYFNLALGNYSVWALNKDKKGNIWIGFWSEGLACFNPKTKTFYKDFLKFKNSDILSQIYINAVVPASNGNVYIGTWDFGLIEIDFKNKIINQYLHNPTDTQTIANNIITDIFETQDGQLILTHINKGISIFNPKTHKAKRIYKKSGISLNTVFLGLEDKEKNLWFASTFGLIKYSNNQIEIYDKTDGVQGEAFSQHGFFINKKGQILLSGYNGFNIFNPKEIKPEKYVPNLLITKLFINNKLVRPNDKTGILKQKISFTKSLQLSYNQRNITFEFLAIDFKNPMKIRYAYKLEGYDKDWYYTDAKRRFAVYTNLPPGKYVFKVKSTNTNGLWTNNIQEIKIKIIPPFYKTIWFYLIVSILAIILLFIFIKYREYKLRKDKERLEQEVKLRTKEIEQQKEEILVQAEQLKTANEKITKQKQQIESALKTIKDSINYAERIQQAMLLSPKALKEFFSDYFLIYLPRDIVSGDFYWIKKINNYLFFAVADCTGHGVPGAFVSMLGISLINGIIVQEKIYSPAKILDILRYRIKQSLQQTGKDLEQKDGMDISLCVIDTKEKTLTYAGANNNLYFITQEQDFITEIKNKYPRKIRTEVLNENTLIEFKADRQPIGIYIVEKPFNQIEFKLPKSYAIYLFSDGYHDQLNEKYEKLKTKIFKKLILEIQNLRAEEQKQYLVEYLQNWKKSAEQTDDITILGVFS